MATIDITTAYGQALLEVGAANPNVVVLDADLADSCKTEAFYAAFPGRAFDLGVAEQSLPTFAAGLALVGKIPFYNTFAVFAVHRGLDMLRQAVAYSRTNVKIIGHAAGQSLGYAGPSHHAIEDVGVLRALPNLVILCPSDAIQTQAMVRWMAEYDGPVYLRLTRSNFQPTHAPDYRFELGATECVCEGDDVSVFVAGDLVALAMQLRDVLQAENIHAQIVNVPTLKPLPVDAIVRHAQSTRAGITIEDHNIIGGLGSAVAEVYAEFVRKPLKRVGIADTFTESDDRDVLLRAYGVSVEHAAQVARETLCVRQNDKPHKNLED